jgi:LPS export ABC transporter protein LptC
MNINIFFTIVASALLMILVLFKPQDIKQNKFEDIALFNISAFTMYELNKNGLSSIMSGIEGIRYSDRYNVKFIDYTDNSQKFMANMKANNGIYKDNTLKLNGNVVYFREDGLTFETQEVTYNKETSIAIADGDYVLYRNNNKVIGNNLRYNNSSGRVQSKNVVAKYQIQESKK